MILGLEGHELETMTGLDCAPDHPRLEGESVEAYLARIEGYLRSTRGRLLPVVSFARYGETDLPDAPDLVHGQ